jgi:hypothetical protein
VFLLSLCAPAAVRAESSTESTLLINEIQTASKYSASEEFIEIVNTSILPFDVSGLTAASGITTKNLYTYNNGSIIQPSEIWLLATTNYLFESEHRNEFTPGLSPTGGSIILVDKNNVVLDTVGWGDDEPTNRETRAIAPPSDGGESMGRNLLDDVPVDTDNNFDDFSIFSEPTPQLPNLLPEEPEEEPPTEDPEDVPPVENPPIPAKVQLYINEVFADPKSPQTDAKNEFVEIYNPTTKNINIGGYNVISGATNKYRHTIGQGVVIKAKSYVVISAPNSNLTLTNSGTTVVLIDNYNREIDDVTYPEAEEGQSWSRKPNNTFVWTTTVTKNSVNIFTIKSAPSTSATKTSTKTSSKSTGKKTNFTIAPPIQLSEIYPDPISPEKDSQDEFIELYNPHPVTINIADYTITSGASRVYKYTIPEATFIKPKGYFVVTSGNTNLSLPNSGGTVTLINNFDKTIDKTDYPDAEPGASWLRVGQKWQWSLSVTKGSENKQKDILESQSSTTQVAGASSGGSDGQPPLTPTPQPLPNWVLAVLGLFAVLYMGYEYRFEISNKVNQLRFYKKTGG